MAIPNLIAALLLSRSFPASLLQRAFARRWLLALADFDLGHRGRRLSDCAFDSPKVRRLFDAKGPALLPGLSYWCALNGWPSGRVSAGDSGIKPPPPDPS